MTTAEQLPPSVPVTRRTVERASANGFSAYAAVANASSSAATIHRFLPSVMFVLYPFVEPIDQQKPHGNADCREDQQTTKNGDYHEVSSAFNA
jgi:hypothetical protein